MVLGVEKLGYFRVVESAYVLVLSCILSLQAQGGGVAGMVRTKQTFQRLGCFISKYQNKGH